jgi:hypothetical protein
MTETNSPPPPGEPVKVAEILTTSHPPRQMKRKDKRLTVPKSSAHKGKTKKEEKEDHLVDYNLWFRT